MRPGGKNRGSPPKPQTAHPQHSLKLVRPPTPRCRTAFFPSVGTTWVPLPRVGRAPRPASCEQGQTCHGGKRACPCTMAPAYLPHREQAPDPTRGVTLFSGWCDGSVTGDPRVAGSVTALHEASTPPTQFTHRSHNDCSTHRTWGTAMAYSSNPYINMPITPCQRTAGRPGERTSRILVRGQLTSLPGTTIRPSDGGV